MSKIQLINRGDLDIYLTGNPSITFFKSVYRKHTNFSMEDIIIQNIPTPGVGHKYAVRLPIRTGDLLYKTDLILRGNHVYCGNGIANISTAVIDNIIFSIGSREIDITYGHYLETWYELNQENPNNTITNIARIEDSSLYHLGQIADQAVVASWQANIFSASNSSYIDVNLAKPTNIMSSGLSYPPTQFQRLSKSGGTYCTPNYTSDTKYAGPLRKYTDGFLHQTTNQKLQSASWSASATYVREKFVPGDIIGDCILPLKFWYCRSPSQAIPLIALSNGVDVEMYIQFASSPAAKWTDDQPSASLISYDSASCGPNDVNNVYSTDVVKPFVSGQKFSFNMDVNATYIYLDDMERKRFKNTSHEYLIEQLQYQNFPASTGSESPSMLDISSFHHPVKELIWTGTPFLAGQITSLNSDNQGSAELPDATATALNNGTLAHISGVRYVTGNTNILYGGGAGINSTGFGNFTPESKASRPFVSNSISGKYVHGLLGPSTPDVLNYCQYKILLNGNDRINWKSLQYFTRENIEKYHKGGCISVPDSIAVYSFALNPANIEPSGTCNFSNIETIQILRNQAGSTNLKGVNVYAINYNILRFVNGQAGLTYVL